LASWTPSQIAAGPDGWPGPPPQRDAALPVIDPPSLCEAGPCARYHRLVTVMEAQGALGSDAPERYRSITRACYPSYGIEIELGETPVLQCSRWLPAPQAHEDAARRDFLASAAGSAFSESVAQYEMAMNIKDEEETP